MTKYLDETGLAHFWDNIKDQPFFNARINGAVADGTTDNSAVLQTILDTITEAGGGTLYLPSGTYAVDKTIVVGDNVRILGDGASSVIHGSQDTTFGVVLAVVGSNVIIDGIAGSYVNDSRYYYSGQANAGFLGISGYTYASAKALASDEITADNLVDADISNIVVQNFSSDSTYPIQCEIGDGHAGHIYDVCYRNLYCPNGVVSAQSNVDGGVIGVSIEGVACSLLRCRSGYVDSGFNVSDVYCNSIDCTQRECNLSNIIVKYEVGCAVYQWALNGTWTVGRIVNIQDSNVSNMLIDACGNDIIGLRVLNVVSSAERRSRLNNVVVRNVSSSTNPAVNINGDDTNRNFIATGCDFSENNAAPNILCGTFVGCKLGDVSSASSFIYADNYVRPAEFTYGTGMAAVTSYDNINTGSYYHYDTVKICGSAYPNDSTYFTQRSAKVIGTVASRYAPKQRQRMHCDVYNSDYTKHSPAVCYVETTGEITLDQILSFSTNVFNRLVINDTYIVGA